MSDFIMPEELTTLDENFQAGYARDLVWVIRERPGYYFAMSKEEAEKLRDYLNEILEANDGV